MPETTFVSQYRGSEVDAAIALTGTNKSNIEALDARVVVNEEYISNVLSGTGGIEEVVAENTSSINSINSDIALLPTSYAAIAGSSSQIFKVADPVSIDEAVSFQFLTNYAAELNGNPSLVFAVGLPVNTNDAVNLGYVNDNFALLNNVYTKTEADAAYLGKTAIAVDASALGGIAGSGYTQKTDYASDTIASIVRKANASEASAGIENTTYMTPSQVKTMINAFADLNTLTPLS